MFFASTSRLIVDYFLLVSYFTSRLLVDYRLVDGSLTTDTHTDHATEVTIGHFCCVMQANNFCLLTKTSLRKMCGFCGVQVVLVHSTLG